MSCLGISRCSFQRSAGRCQFLGFSLIAIFLTQIYLHWIPWEQLCKINFSALLLIGKKLLNLILRQKNKSTDLIDIPVFIYKNLARQIFPTISMLFNNSLSEGIFPKCFKTAKIVQIFQSCYSNSTLNYRPIFMLPFLSKNIWQIYVC